MIFPRITKGIVPCDLIEDFSVENILNAKVTSSGYLFFAEMKDYITTFTLTTSLLEMNDNPMV